MKKKLKNERTGIIVVIALLLTIAFSLIVMEDAHAATSPRSYGAVAAKDGVFVRKTPSTAATVTNTLSKGSSVTIYSVKFTSSTSTKLKCRWYYTNRGGYIRADLVSLKSYNRVFGRSKAALNYRTGAGLKFARKGTLSKGVSKRIYQIAIAADGSKWYKISCNGMYRYVRASYMYITTNSTASTSSTSSASSSNKFSSMTAAEFDNYLDSQGFPESYQPKLKALHAIHPNWGFTAKKINSSWSSVASRQAASANLFEKTYLSEAYLAVDTKSYNFNGKYYIGKDGSRWVTASAKAVKYYMDPRNNLTENGVFVFENHAYDPSSQTSSMVRTILSGTAMKNNSLADDFYMTAGKTYGVSPVYLASKSRLELGTSSFMINGHYFTYGGRSYKFCYNAFNIGSTDSSDGSAATKGLVFANGGPNKLYTSYGRPWNNLQKAIRGGAQYIAGGYINNRQYTSYYERFNVLNGLSYVGTHQYMTALYGASSTANIVYNSYRNAGMLNMPFNFEIPVYLSMGSYASPRPASSGNNNCYLESLKLTTGKTITTYMSKSSGTTTRNKTSFVMTVAGSVSTAKISAVSSASDAKVYGSGTKSLKVGVNTFKVKCVSSTGLSRSYTIKITRKTPTFAAPTSTTGLEVSNTGAATAKISWNKATNATGYRIYYSKGDSTTWTYLTKTCNTNYTVSMKTIGTTYRFKVRAYRTAYGVTKYSTSYSNIGNAATFNTTFKLKSSVLTDGTTASYSWYDILGADGYKVFYRKVGTTAWSTTYVTKAGFGFAMTGTSYECKVVPYRLINSQKYYSGVSSLIVTVKKTAV